jgi:hypothetical protein
MAGVVGHGATRTVAERSGTAGKARLARAWLGQARLGRHGSRVAARSGKSGRGMAGRASEGDEMTRKAIRKSVRFEVFKRDSFTCQYCGQKAPDVVLEVDHITPVADGGDNAILNLVTACRACNAGKSDKSLSDSAALEKARAQAEDLE